MSQRVGRLLSGFLVIFLALPATAYPAEERLKGVKVPDGWSLTLFAAPPEIHYPTCLAAAPTGEVFVGVDENGSIDAKPRRGRVVRCVDKDGDGTADAFTVFAEMDSPRGLVYDPSTATLYVQHPPTITAYHDDNGDGVSDRQEVLVEGIGFDLKRRGADHTTNGIRLGIDGFLYVAVGDYGFVKAVGKDGATAQLHGGGIARVRTDGSGLEVYSRGQRNIYDVAIDPYLNVFTRDNTNDGGGWDVRLSHVIATAEMGYPSLFTNFGDEIVTPLADYGGGSPCGSLYLQEPGFPAGFGDTLYTCDWGRNVVYRHPLTPQGAGFKADQVPFVEMPRPTDMDVDGQGRIYLSSWKDGGFTFSGPDVGYVIRVTPPGRKPPAFPDLKSARDDALIGHLASASAVLRQAAQREILKRGNSPARAAGVRALVASKNPLAVRVAALLTFAQLDPGVDLLSLVGQGRAADLREFAIRAEAEAKVKPGAARVGPIVEAVSDRDPRVRLQAVVALGRLGTIDAAPAVVRATADADPLVAHAAVKALVRLKAVDACLGAIDPKTPELVAGAARALQGVHDGRAVDGLIGKLGAATDDTARRPIFKALCRLYAREADWDGGWWSTRPDTSGPYYKAVAWDQSEKVAEALRGALAGASDASARWLLAELIKNKVEIEGVTERALKLAATDPVFRAETVGVLANRPNLPASAFGLLGRVAASGEETPALRARALRGLIRSLNQSAARDAAVDALAAVGRLDRPPGELSGVWQDFVKDGRQARYLADYSRLAEGPDADRAVVAYGVLLQVDADPKAPASTKQVAHDAIARALARPDQTARLLRAVGLTRSQTYAAQVRDRLDATDPGVRLAAREAARRLGLDSPAGRAGGDGPLIARLTYDQAIASVQKEKEKGDVALGAVLFERVGCVACHTVLKSEPAKGPYLGDIATRYSRTELAESVLKPSAKIAQGFETQKFATVDGQTYEGFVVRESGDEVEIRNAAGAVTVINKADIEERGKTTISVMPTGLAEPLAPRELASILAYLESLKPNPNP